jgi:hypothetical protein
MRIPCSAFRTDAAQGSPDSTSAVQLPGSVKRNAGSAGVDGMGAGAGWGAGSATFVASLGAASAARLSQGMPDLGGIVSAGGSWGAVWGGGAGAGAAAEGVAAGGVAEAAGAAGSGTWGVDTAGAEGAGGGAEAAGGGAGLAATPAAWGRTQTDCMHCRSSAQSDEAEQVAPSTPSFFTSHASWARHARARTCGVRMARRNTSGCGIAPDFPAHESCKRVPCRGSMLTGIAPELVRRAGTAP